MPATRRPSLAWRLLPARIGARLYLLSGLALATVATLALAAMHFVTLARAAARDIRDRVQVELMNVSEFELLLERHRRLVESAPVELDHSRVTERRQRAGELVAAMNAIAPGPGSQFAERIASALPELARLGDATLRHAGDVTRAAAIGQADAYTDVARTLARQIAAHKAAELAALDRDIVGIVAGGTLFARWVTAGSVLALVLIGPVSLLVTGQIVRRLKTMTSAMMRLARNDISVYISGTRYLDELGEMARALGVFKANAVALQTLNQRFEFALENMTRGLSMFDGEHRLIVCNRLYCELYSLPPALSRPGTPFEEIVAYRIQAGTGRMGETPTAGRLPWPCDDPPGLEAAAMIALRHELADGRTIEIAYRPLKEGGWVALHEDVTAERQQEAHIERLAHFDNVTGIANRHYFKEALDDELAKIAASGGGFAVHWIDLDRFKQVNDTFGHPTGDALLEQVAARLVTAVREDDFVARLGGDEFAIIQKNVTGSDAAQALARRLIKVVSKPYVIVGHRVEIGASCGVVVAPLHGIEAEDLIRNADIALYEAKATGRGCTVVFENALEAGIMARRSLEADILEAVAANAFDMHYQPIVSLQTGRVTVCEALMRWTHPVRGPVSPAVFIPVAEEIGAITALGAFALRRACADAAGWPPGIKVAVNLSPVQFGAPGFVDTVIDILVETGLDPARLELEITETVLMRDDAATIAILERLRAQGISFALDDFGSGYSSLNYLRRFPFDKIKIDQSFIRDLPSRNDCVAIVRAIADLAKTLGMRTVAEGVETADHLNRVLQAGCDEVQGFLISCPVANTALPDAISCATGGYRAVAA